jgi:hypothetical protein
MTPWQKAKQWQEDNDATTSFEELLGAHLSAGYIWNSPQVFLLAGEVRWNAQEENFENGPANCWFVRLAAGANCANAPWELMRLFPHPHKYVAWFRRQQFQPRIYDWDKLLKKVKGK